MTNRLRESGRIERDASERRSQKERRNSPGDSEREAERREKTRMNDEERIMQKILRWKTLMKAYRRIVWSVQEGGDEGWRAIAN